MKNIRIIFMGTPKFSCSVLNMLIDNHFNVVAVVTQPDKCVGRKKVLQASPIKELANKHNIDVIQPINIKENACEVLEYKPDLVITCAYGQIIAKSILEYPKYKCINVHASLLPKYRGGAPIHHAIINGEKETGITIMHMIDKMDAGDILVQKSIPIEKEDTTNSMFDKLSLLGSELLLEILPDYINGLIKPIEQDVSKVTYAYNISRDDEYINFNRDVIKVYNNIRGLISWPVGYSIINNMKIKIHQADYILGDNSIPSKVYGYENDGIKVGAINGYIIIKQLQLAGKNVVKAREFYNGYSSRMEGYLFNEQE